VKKYYNNLLKSFNVVHILMIFIFFLSLNFIGDYLYGKVVDGQFIEMKMPLLSGAFYFASGLITLLGFNKIKDDKISFLDLLRNGLLLSTLGSIGLLFIDELNITNLIILAVFGVCLIVQIILRMKYVSENSVFESGFKKYIASVCAKFNPLTIVLLGTVIGVVMMNFKAFETFINEYYYAIFLTVIMGAGIILPLSSKDDCNFIDVIMMSLGVSFVVFASFGQFSEKARFLEIFMGLVILLEIYFRGLSYSGKVSDSSLKLNNYYKDLFIKYDFCLPFVLANIIVATMLSSNVVYPIISIVVGFVMFLGVLMHNKFKSKEITLSDYFLSCITMSSIMLIPVLFNINFLKMNRLSLFAAIFNGGLLVLSIVINIIRVKSYGVLALDDNKQEEQEIVVEETKVVEEVKQEEVNVVEEKIEETTLVEEIEENKQESIYEDDQDELEEEASEEDEQEDQEEQEESDEDEGSVLLSIDNVNGLAGNKNVKRKFNTKLMLASDDAKYYYSEIKNYLQMYRANGRYSSRCETYRYKGVIAKVALAGKSIKVYLAIDPASVDGKYNFKDASDKKQYKEVPVMIKVKSARGLKYFKELVDMMMASRDVKPKRKYEPIDYTISLIPNGEAIFTELGVGDDYIYDTIHVKNIPSDLPDELGKFLPNIQGEKIEGDVVYATIHLDTLCNHFNDGDIIDMTTLKNLNLINRGNALRIKARGTLDRKLVIFADDFDPDAVKMILCTNGTAVKIER